MLKLYRLFLNTLELPIIIRIWCVAGLVLCPLTILLVVLPLFNWTIGGYQLSYREFWYCGTGLAMLVFGIVGTAGFWGMAARIPATRWLLVLMPAAPTLVMILYPGPCFVPESLMNTDIAVSVQIHAFIIYASLFHLPSIRRYFKLAGDSAQK
ncbi:hypothetical protein ACO0LF_30695 [Undibacterium sp. Di27W]|uniref:hypothetical protein n=1 Tax=Undibacterium sp. Di27W TaxID=3413036 RepID=UPI003BF3684C